MLSVTTSDEAIDPGGIERRDPTKVLPRRYLAYLVDFLVVALVAVLALSFTAEANTLDELSDRLQLEGDQRLQAEDVKRYERDDDRSMYVLFFRDVPVLEDQLGVLVVEDSDLQVVFLFAAAAWILLYVGLQGFTGATVGKGAAGIRCVRASGDPPGVLRALVRSILLPIDSLPSAPFLPLVGTVFAVATTGNRRLGDLVGGTYVVDKDAMGSPVRSGESDAFPSRPDERLPGPDPLAVPVTPEPTAAPGDQPPAWAQGPAAPEPQDLDWTAEQPAPTAATDPWAPVAGAGTAASDWEQAIAEEQVQSTPEPAAQQPAVTEQPAAAAADGPTIDDYEPQWDEQRRSYIQWDPRRDEWLQYSDELKQWHPIDRPPTS